jgi:hypothetical protein
MRWITVKAAAMLSHSTMILRFPVTPRATGQPLYGRNDDDHSGASQFWTWTSPVLGDDKAVR